MTILFKIDKKAKQAFDAYAQGKPASMTFINSYDDGKQAVLTKVMTPLSNIIQNDYGFSIKVVLDTLTADELNQYDSLGQRLVPNGFTYKKLLNDDDKLFLKLKTVDDRFAALSFATPANYEEINLEAQNLNVTFNMGVWVNFEKQTAGSFLKIVSITKV